MQVETQKAAGLPAVTGGGRRPTYPYATMMVGEFFFIAGKTHNTICAYASSRGRMLGRRFNTRLLWMKREDGKWVDATEGEPGAVQGVYVYRAE